MNERRLRAEQAGYVLYAHRDIIETALTALLLEGIEGSRFVDALAAYDEIVELLSLPTEVAA